MVDLSDNVRGLAAADPARWVGPVLAVGAVADALIAAIRRLNADVQVTDCGAYVRVACLRRCRVTLAVLEYELGRSFALPGDLELVMCAFKGQLSITSSEVLWSQ